MGSKAEQTRDATPDMANRAVDSAHGRQIHRDILRLQRVSANELPLRYSSGEKLVDALAGGETLSNGLNIGQ